MRILLLIALFVSACGGNDAPEEAAQLLQRVQSENYRSWQRAPGYETRQPTSAPHGEEVDIYVNTVLNDALRGPAIAEWPVGSVVVKDGFDGGLDIIAVMEKRAEGWFFAEYDSDGSPLFSGAPSACTSCHGGAGILAFPLPR